MATRRSNRTSFDGFGLTLAGVTSFHPAGTELVPVEALRSGDPITDVHAGGQCYIVLESRSFDDSCMILELESKANGELRVIEKSFPAGYMVGRSPRHSF